MQVLDDETRKKIIHDEMSRRAKIRWAKMTKEQRSEYCSKIAKAPRKKKDEQLVGKEK